MATKGKGDVKTWVRMLRSDERTGKEWPYREHYKDGGLRDKTTDEVASLYERLWTSMVANPDALEAVRAYAWPEVHRKRKDGKVRKKNRHLPPAAYFEVVYLYLNLRGIHYTKRPSDMRTKYYQANKEAYSMQPEILIDEIASLAREWAEHRAQARAKREALAGDPSLTMRAGTGGWVPQSPDDDDDDEDDDEKDEDEGSDIKKDDYEVHYAGWSIPEGGVESNYEYLVVSTAAWMETIAVLLAVPRRVAGAYDPSDGERRGPDVHVLGREWNHYPGALAEACLAPSSRFTPALRPYASIVPTMLWSMADAQSLLQWGKKTDRVKARHRERSPVHRALDPLVAQLKRARSMAELPPEVMLHLPIKPSSWAMYAWLSEGQLATALNVAYGRHAAAASLPYATRFPMIASAITLISDDASTPTSEQSSSSSPSSLDRLDVMAARALAKKPMWIEWATLPEHFLNALGFEVWQAITLGSHRSGDSSALPLHEHMDDFKALIGLARAWGIQPTEAQLRHPVLLCGALAREAIMKKVPRAAVLTSEASERLGVLRLTWHEREAWKDVCESHPRRRFARVPWRMRKASVANDVCRKVYTKMMGPIKNDKDIAVMKSLNNLFFKANTQLDKRKKAGKLSREALRDKFNALLAQAKANPDDLIATMESISTFLEGDGRKLLGESDSDDSDNEDEEVADDGPGGPPLPAKTQAILAWLAIRSGIPIKADDLANAGQALAALTPAIALTT